MGRKSVSWIDVISYEGPDDVLVYKHPTEDFNDRSVLIVHQSQEAIFFKNGRAIEVFGPGKHFLTTENYPFLRAFGEILTGGASKYHCEVYFVNMTLQSGVRWGTGTKVEYIDPVYNFPVKLGASGEMVLRVGDSRKLVTKIVGTEWVLHQNKATDFLKGTLIGKVKNYLVQTIREKKLSIFELDGCLDEFSTAMCDMLQSDFEMYGLVLEKLNVMHLAKPDGDEKYERVKKLQYRKYFDVAEAELEGQVKNIRSETASRLTGHIKFCWNCGYKYKDNENFCPECGQKR